MKRSTLKNCHRAFILIACGALTATALSGFDSIKSSFDVSVARSGQVRLLNEYKQSEEYQDKYDSEYQKLLAHAASSKMPIESLNNEVEELSSNETTLEYFRAYASPKAIQEYSSLEELENISSEEATNDLFRTFGITASFAGATAAWGLASTILERRIKKEENAGPRLTNFSPQIAQKIQEIDENTNQM